MSLRVRVNWRDQPIVRIGLLSLFIVALIIPLAYYSSLARADDQTISWSSSTPTVIPAPQEPSPSAACLFRHQVKRQQVQVAGVSGPQSACVSIGQYLTMGVYNNSHVAVSYPGDSQMYKVNMSCFVHPDCVYVPARDMLVARETTGGYYATKLVAYKHVTQRLHRITNPDTFVTEYIFDTSNPDFIFKDATDTVLPVRSMDVSANSRWLVGDIDGAAVFRMDLEDFTARKFSNAKTDYRFNVHMPEYDTTDDGAHIAMMGQNIGAEVYDVTDACGRLITVQDTYAALRQYESDMCPSFQFAEHQELFSTQFGTGRSPEFSSDGGELRLYADSENKWISLRVAGYTPPSLEYLALGDSYSSGEGDIDTDQFGATHYLPYTDTGPANGALENRCHISTRSYSFKLRDAFGIEEPKMKSVACSGALTRDVQSNLAQDKYLGQNNRLAGIGMPEVDQLRAQAKTGDIPGYIKQIEFVEKYKPKAITLTIGGNDAGFEDLIKSCASSLFSCDYVNNVEFRSRAGNDIKNQFTNITRTISTIRIVSPETKIYLLGYPQFIYNGTAICGLNVGATDSAERLLITEAVKYMNQVVRAAADASGVVYIDIENSLDGGRMCESGGYVTGVSDVNLSPPRFASTFHPNALGHQKIADAIVSQVGSDTILTYNHTTPVDPTRIAPAPTSYFAGAMQSYDKNVERRDMIQSPTGDTTSATKGEYADFIINPFSLNKDPTSRTLNSNPIDLGDFTADEQGGYKGSILIPMSVPAGFHTLVVSGKTYSGEPIDYHQTILIKGSDPNDIDEDGVADTTDPCLFIQASGLDSDLDGQDDACDPFIGPPRPVYRLRAGIPSRTYNGTPEIANYLYLERNIFAKAITGITGDYDPDHDDYATIAASNSTATAGPYARLQTDTTQIPNTISLSFRTPENGCVRYKPTDLSQVTQPTNNRTFTQEATDTNTCREQPVTVDLDNNGQPDNTQPLYRAHNGIAANGENPAKLYLKRSTRGAEAQLNKSDYASNISTASNPVSSTDTTDYRKEWSLLASTQSKPLIPVTYKELFTASNGQLYLLATTNLLGLCQAYKPGTLNTIKQSTQNTTNLTLDIAQTLTVQLQGACNG